MNHTTHETIVIRHAPTKSNESARFMGTVDTPSTADGLAHARALGDRLSVEDSVLLYTSPLQRSLETLKMLRPGRSGLIDSRLRERDLGEWEGSLRKEVRVRRPDAFVRNGTLDPFVTPPGGESPESFIARIGSFLEHLIEANPNGKSLLVTHNGVIAAMRALTGGISLREAFMEEEPFLSPRTLVVDSKALRLDLSRVLTEIENSREGKLPSS